MLFRLVCLFVPALCYAANSYTIQTVAGSSSMGDGGSAQSAILSQPEGLAADSGGNLYIADAEDCRIRKVLPSGLIQTLAGTGTSGFGGDLGPASSALLNQPYGLALDAFSGNLYVADLGNARVRKITPDGQITTVAGGGAITPSLASDGTRASAIKLQAPRNVAVDRAGNLYIADFGAHSIYRVDSAGLLYTVAGTGKAGTAAEGATAKLAPLSSPAGLVLDSSGSLFFADSGNNCVRKISAGLITTVFSTQGPTGLAINSAGTLYVAGSVYFGTVTRPVGQALSGRDVAVDGAGNLYLSSNSFVWRVGTDTSLSIKAGSGASKYYGGDGGPALQARFHNPMAIVRDDLGNSFIADTGNNRIRMIAATGLVTTFAGTGETGSGLGNGQPVLAQLSAPRGLALDSMRNLYVADSGNNRICRISPSGTFAVIASGLTAPQAVAIDGNDALYVAETGANRIVKVSAAGVLSKVTDALQPAALLFDQQGDLFLSESSRVSKLSAQGVLTTVLDSLNAPGGLAFAGDGSLLVAETGAQVIRAVTPAGLTMIVAGLGTAGFSGDGQTAMLAQLSSPAAITVDGSGNIWIADSGNQGIRQLTPQQPSNVSTPLSHISIVNAASLAGVAIAPGEIVSIFGTGFDAATSQVTFDGTAATVFYASATQINALVPVGVKPGASTHVVVSVKGVSVGEVSQPVVAAAPAIFAGSTGLAAAVNEDGTVQSADNPATKGSIVMLFGTGWNTTANNLVVSIGGYAAQVLYAGPAPGFPGLNQINLQVPGGFLAPGIQPLAVMVGDAAISGPVSLAVR